MGTDALTTTGTVAGIEEGPLLAVRGVRYAEPPVGALRWQPPVPAKRWSGTLDAKAFGPSAPQVDGPPSLLPVLEVRATDESCLTLNIWAPHDTARRDRPVLVWIHGGAFISGGSSISSYNGAVLASEGDLVVVSVNYRLGALGFAPVDGTANLGLLDQIEALRWIRDNIAAFGGDPETVTVMGESAGGGSIMHLLASPRATGLFRRAIVQSGATTLTLRAEGATEVADRIRSALAPMDPMAAPVEAVMDAQVAVTAEMIATLGTMPFHPAVDGEIVTALPVEALAGGAARGIDLLIGTTANELNTYLDPAAADLERERLVKRAAKYLPLFGVRDPDVVLEAYTEMASSAAVWAALRTDAEMWLPAVDAAEAHAASGGRAFMYRFDWPAAPPNGHLGACHAIDIPFTFGTFDQVGWGEFVGVNADAIQLGISLRQAWAAFAATGDPSTPGLGDWPTYQVDGRSTMLLGRVPSVAGDPRGQVRNAWTNGGNGGHRPDALNS